MRAPKQAFRARRPPIFTLCSFKIDVFLRVFVGTSKICNLKIDVSCEASVNFQHMSQNATPATEFAPCRHLTQPCQCDLQKTRHTTENLHRSCVLTGGLCFMDWAPPNRHQTLHFGPKRNHAILMDSWLTGGTKKINHKAMQV